MENSSNSDWSISNQVSLYTPPVSSLCPCPPFFYPPFSLNHYHTPLLFHLLLLALTLADSIFCNWSSHLAPPLMNTALCSTPPKCNNILKSWLSCSWNFETHHHCPLQWPQPHLSTMLSSTNFSPPHPIILSLCNGLIYLQQSCLAYTQLFDCKSRSSLSSAFRHTSKLLSASFLCSQLLPFNQALCLCATQ